MHLGIDFCPQVPQTQMHLGLESLRSWLRWAGRNPVDRTQRKGAKDKHTRPKDEHGVPQPRVQMRGCANPAGNVLRHTPLQLCSPAYPLVLSAATALAKLALVVPTLEQQTRGWWDQMNSYRLSALHHSSVGFVTQTHLVGLGRVLRNTSQLRELGNRTEPSDHSFRS